MTRFTLARRHPSQLAVFLEHLTSFLAAQQQLVVFKYRIFIVNQTDLLPFNRAKLLNVGFLEASREFNWSCVVFHDIDLLPEDVANLYTCAHQPLHLSSR